MMGNSATSRWVYLTVGLIVMAELVTVSGRGHIDYPSSFGPKERRKRQVDQNDAFSLLSSLSRPAGGTPAAQTANGAATGKQLDLNNNAFGGLIGGIFNQALSNLARPVNNGGGVNSGLGVFGNPQAWANFGANPQGVPFQQQPGGGDVSFPGKVTPTTTTTKATTTAKAKATTTVKATNSKLTTTTKKSTNRNNHN
ncbi:hypothetical protein DAPPUDRAFT_300613 [Daphnia pulex]|uniref:Uncharacterized protein n=1 Tax=Daphnia pulex TaxID=6669 RepID=E9HZU0_DAPPU|nr:hypothetical protein DAPPUDRAFT_300613 [Daphnia pulex]|eukprot:EFX62739.1 hypothetical protein DAPPUDRAFT_300613 [Daphnia pulex]